MIAECKPRVSSGCEHMTRNLDGFHRCVLSFRRSLTIPIPALDNRARMAINEKSVSSSSSSEVVDVDVVSMGVVVVVTTGSVVLLVGVVVVVVVAVSSSMTSGSSIPAPLQFPALSNNQNAKRRSSSGI